MKKIITISAFFAVMGALVAQPKLEPKKEPTQPPPIKKVVVVEKAPPPPAPKKDPVIGLIKAIVDEVDHDKKDHHKDPHKDPHRR